MDTRTHYEFERDECNGWAKWLGTVAIPIVLVGLIMIGASVGGIASSYFDTAEAARKEASVVSDGRFRIVKLVEEHNNG